jgi:hypothetical protein
MEEDGRSRKEINTTDLIQDLNNSKFTQNREGSVVNVVKLYNSELSSIIDKHAPLKSKNIILRPNTEWYSDELRAAKRDLKSSPSCISGEVCLFLNKYLETFHDELSNLIYAYVVRLYDGNNSTIMQTTPSVRDPCLFDRNGNPSGDHYGACLSMMELSSVLYSFTTFTTDPSRFWAILLLFRS